MAGPDAVARADWHPYRHPYVRETSGRYTRRRHAWGWISQLLFFGLPWLAWDGRRLFLIDVAAVEATLFGFVVRPPELAWLALPLLALAVLLLVLSGRVGRLFCGFICAHTVYADVVLWVERRIEGSRTVRMRRDALPMSVRYFLRKTLKHAVFVLLSMVNGVTLVAWFTPLHLAPVPGAVALLYSSITYINAVLLRHRVCSSLCPLGFLQAALAGPRTLVVTYSAARGEPRGLRNAKRAAAMATLGDCLDCTLCIQVCPSGSDIRNGPHAACIGCGACADACDRVMRQRGLPTGLIGFASDELVSNFGNFGVNPVFGHELIFNTAELVSNFGVDPKVGHELSH